MEATIHLVTRNKRTGATLWDNVWCASCAAEHQRAFASDKGVTISARPWTGAPRACDSCDDSELAPELRRDAVWR